MTVKELIDRLSTSLNEDAEVFVSTDDGYYEIKDVDLFSSVNNAYLYSEELSDLISDLHDEIQDLEVDIDNLESLAYDEGEDD